MDKQSYNQGSIFQTDLRDLQVRPIMPGEETFWNAMMSRYHYLGFRTLVGESLKYIAILDDKAVGLIVWGSAAFKNHHRDKWIGWSPEVQWQRLKYIANNMRFLILEGKHIKNLASKILSLNLKRLSQDWMAIYGHQILLVETFVDKSKFRGTCYRAAGWIPLGYTKGYRRSGGRYYYHGQTKGIFVRPLCKTARHLLSAPFLSPQLQNQEQIMDLNTLKIEGDSGLFKRLVKLTDPRKPRGIRHNQASIMAIAICACLSGCRSFSAIGHWASNLTQELCKRFKCRKNHRTGRHTPPSEPTIRRVLQKTDAEEADKMISEWLNESDGEAIAVDGKTQRGSKSKDKKAVHLLSALLHKEKVVIAQKEVDSKTNEIKAFKPLLENVDIKGKIVTADAMHAQKEHAKYVKEIGGDYVFIVKNNQSTILEAIKDLDIEFFSL